MVSPGSKIASAGGGRVLASGWQRAHTESETTEHGPLFADDVLVAQTRPNALT